MKPGHIWFWIVLAAGLFAFIMLRPRHTPLSDGQPHKLLPELNAEAVTSIQVRPAGTASLQIRAERATNGTWRLVEPFRYPAQATNVMKLLDALAGVEAATWLSPAEIRNRPNAEEEEFGFSPSQASIIIQQGGYRAHLLIGGLTAPGDQAYVQVVAREGIYVVDSQWLKCIPRSANEWRDKALLTALPEDIDRLAVTNNAKAFVLQREAAGQWKMNWPLTAARADKARIETSLHNLTQTELQEFVSDDPKADLDNYGLSRPELELALTAGTNQPVLLQFGKINPGATNQVYGRRFGESAIFTVKMDNLLPWRRASVNAFRDPHLLTLAQLPDSIEATTPESFALSRQTNGAWRAQPTDVVADGWLVAEFIGALTNLQIIQFTKDVVNSPELPEFGLSEPLRKYVLRNSASNSSPAETNCIMVELDFGRPTNATDKVFVRRTDESSVYAISTNDFARLPWAAWQLQERQLFTFNEQDVLRLIINDHGKNRELLRRGDHLWSLAPGSQGIINDLAVEETVKGLARASARSWIDKGQESFERYGLNRPHRLTFVLKSGENVTLDFGGPAPLEAQYAAIKRGADTYVLELGWHLYRDVASYLSVP